MKTPSFLNIDNSGSLPIISIDGIIGTSYWDDQYSFDEFKWNMDMLGDVTEIDVLLSSAGGNVDIGIAIYNYLKQHPAKINMHVISQASSIASVIFLAGDTRTMGIGTTMFIHKPMMGVMGYDDDLDKASSDLKVLWGSIIDIYEAETGQPRDTLVELMENETLMNANECFRRGFSNTVSNDATNVVDYTYVDINQLARTEALNMTTKNGDNKPETDLNAIMQSVAALTDIVNKLSDKIENNVEPAEPAEPAELVIDNKSTETVVENSKSDILKIKGICVAAKVPENLSKAFEALSFEDAKSAVNEFIETKEISIASSSGKGDVNSDVQNVFSKAFKSLQNKKG